MTKRRWIILVAACVLGLGTGAWSSRQVWLPSVGRWLDVGEVPRQVDYVMSLPGDEHYRPFVAAAMVNANLAERALIVQTEASPAELDGIALPSSELIRRVYLYCGVPESKLIVLTCRSASTADDIGALADFLQTQPRATVAIVTSDYHTRRSRWTFRRQLGSLANRLTIISAPNGEFNFDCWWQIENGFLQVTMEYIKLTAYAIVYGQVIWWLAAGALLIVVVRFVWKRQVHRRDTELTMAN